MTVQNGSYNFDLMMGWITGILKNLKDIRLKNGRRYTV